MKHDITRQQWVNMSLYSKYIFIFSSSSVYFSIAHSLFISCGLSLRFLSCGEIGDRHFNEPSGLQFRCIFLPTLAYHKGVINLLLPNGAALNHQAARWWCLACYRLLNCYTAWVNTAYHTIYPLRSDVILSTIFFCSVNEKTGALVWTPNIPYFMVGNGGNSVYFPG